jgi:hypothetical protein
MGKPKEKTFNTVFDKIKNTKIVWLIMLPGLIGILILLIAEIIGGAILHTMIPLRYTVVLTSLVFFLASLSGFAPLIKRDSPELVINNSIFGKIVIVVGIIFAIQCIFLCIALLLFAFSSN